MVLQRRMHDETNRPHVNAVQLGLQTGSRHGSHHPIVCAWLRKRMNAVPFPTAYPISTRQRCETTALKNIRLEPFEGQELNKHGSKGRRTARTQRCIRTGYPWCWDRVIGGTIELVEEARLISHWDLGRQTTRDRNTYWKAFVKETRERRPVVKQGNFIR